MESLGKLFWNEKFWLSEGTTWDNIHEYTGVEFNKFLLLCCGGAVVLYLIRLIFERLIATPIGKFFDIPDRRPCEPNRTLEAYYSDDRVFSESIITLISKDTHIEYEKVKSWLIERKKLNKPSTLQKFNEATWRFVFYFAVWIYGVVVLKDKIWTWDTNHAWINYPKQYLTNDVYIYYIVEISFYLSLVVSQFSDVKRKDFWQMFVHHLVTLMLLVFSLSCNFVRIGSLVLVCHDTVDWLLEFAKMANYCKKKWVSDPIFGVFTLVWIVTRLYLYPTRILNSVLYQNSVTKFPSYHALTILLCSLQVMHIIWFWMILRVIHRAIFQGVIEDDRSSYGEEEKDVNIKND